MTKNTIKEKEDKMTDDKAWIFVIDTDKYAGNFEREMCAFMTGIIGECGIGVEEAQLYYEQTGLSPKDIDWDKTPVEYADEDLENPFCWFVTKKQDEYGCYRPVSIWPTPGWFNHGLGGHFQDGQEEKALIDYKICYLRRAAEKVHPNDQEHHETTWRKKADKPLNKHDAYLSVAIFFEQKPSEEMCHRMMERAKSYMEYCRKMPNKYERHDITIGGFRLLEETIRQVEIGSWTV